MTAEFLNEKVETLHARYTSHIACDAEETAGGTVCDELDQEPTSCPPIGRSKGAIHPVGHMRLDEATGDQAQWVDDSRRLNTVRRCASSCRAARGLTRRCTCAPTRSLSTEGQVELIGKGGRDSEDSCPARGDSARTGSVRAALSICRRNEARDGRMVWSATSARVVIRWVFSGAACMVFAATAACEFVDLKRALGYTETEARRELAMWLGHNPHRTEVTYAYVPKNQRA